MIMKKEYIIPKVETVHPNLKGSILEDVNINLGSGDTGRQGAKGNVGFFDEDEDNDNAADADNTWINSSEDLWK
jgi:hypothetical protein